MPVFSYKAVDSDGGSFSGTLSANTAYEARTELRDRGLRILSITEQAVSRTQISISSRP